MPRINFNWDIGTLHTQAQIYGGWYNIKYGNVIDITYQATHYTADSIQYFWAEGKHFHKMCIKVDMLFSPRT